jgi:hypothetical protein
VPVRHTMEGVYPRTSAPPHVNGGTAIQASSSAVLWHRLPERPVSESRGYVAMPVPTDEAIAAGWR